MSRTRNITWTFFPKPGRTTVEELKVKLEAETAFSIFGWETTEKGEEHLQGYSHLKNPKTFKAFGKLTDKTMHLENSKGSAEDNRDYCSKGEQPHEEWATMKKNGPNYGKNANVWSCGTMPKQGIRTDIHELRDACENVTALSDIIADDQNVVALAKYGRFAQMVYASASKKRSRAFRNLEVIVHWGETGTNKTRTAYDEGAFKWSPSGHQEWWDGYDGEDILLIDEFYGQLKPARLLELLDGYSCRLPIKGGFTYAAWTKVYITSNAHPSMWYKDIPDEVQRAVCRRVSRSIQFVKNSNGDIECVL